MQLARGFHAAGARLHARLLTSKPVGLAGSRRLVVRQVQQQETPNVMLSGEETDEGDDHLAGDYCSLDARGKRVKGNRT